MHFSYRYENQFITNFQMQMQCKWYAFASVYRCGGQAVTK